MMKEIARHYQATGNYGNQQTVSHRKICGAVGLGDKNIDNKRRIVSELLPHISRSSHR